MQTSKIQRKSKIRRRNTLLSLVGLTFIVSLAANADPLMVDGMGQASCGTWTSSGTNSGDPNRVSVDRALMLEWVNGYITAVNQFAPHSNMGNIQGSADGQALQGWISNYCVAHPLDLLATASARLILELRHRANDDDPNQPYSPKN